MLIGVVSDTHCLLRSQVRHLLAGTDLIIHAGDIGCENILNELKAIAPLVAVRGNCDRGEWADLLPLTNIFDAENKLIYIIHELAKLEVVPESAGISIVVYGHSHNPSFERKGSVIYLNPGSAGPRRFNLPVSLALMRIIGDDAEVEFIDLADN